MKLKKKRAGRKWGLTVDDNLEEREGRDYLFRGVVRGRGQGAGRGEKASKSLRDEGGKQSSRKNSVHP